jgi:hypothetical protein
MRVNRLLVVLVSITLYWYLIPAFGVESGGSTKAGITLFLLLAAVVLIQNYITNYRQICVKLEGTGVVLLGLLLIVNGVNIIRGSFFSEVPLTTTLGNPYNALALVTPFAVAFATSKVVLVNLNRYLLLIMAIGGGLSLASFASSGLIVVFKDISSAWILIYPMVFLIGSANYLGRATKYSIFGMSFLYFWYIGLVVGSRATLLRISLLYLFKWVSKMPRTLMTRLVYPVLLLCLVVFSYQTISSSLSTDKSIFQLTTKYLQDIVGNKSEASVLDKPDTRTFLYIEVISDLLDTGNLIFGKGSSGTYYSPYFQATEHDADTRLTVEVGLLAVLLKGGILAALLNIVLILYSSCCAICKSNSMYVRWVGFALFVHLGLLFSENLVSLDLYNLCIWLFVGIGISKEFHAMTDGQIKLLINKYQK